MFQRIDANGDGALTQEEMKRHHKHMQADRKDRMQERREHRPDEDLPE